MPIKKIAEKTAKKTSCPKPRVCKSCKEKPIGEITHYFGGINVAIIKFKKTVEVGEKIKIKGANTDFEQAIESMQYEHKDIKSAKKNQEVGIKVSEKVREGDMVYPVE
ncbi:MAG: translation elongation factor-like protein [bacterium]|nr:translation elongation factor-like protein [bacterium]